LKLGNAKRNVLMKAAVQKEHKEVCNRWRKLNFMSWFNDRKGPTEKPSRQGNSCQLNLTKKMGVIEELEIMGIYKKRLGLGW